MLETVKAKLTDEPSITFEEYFTKYVMDMQDSMIEAEMSFLVSRNLLDVNSMIKLTSIEQKGLM